MNRYLRSCAVGSLVALISGCSSGGLDTVPVSGTLEIDGQPADNITISLIPIDAKAPTASGRVVNGQFTVYSGVEGAPGALPGAYKVVLHATTTDEAAILAGKEPAGESGGQSELPFPEKYLNAKTSDQQVDVIAGSNKLKIEIQSAASPDAG